MATTGIKRGSDVNMEPLADARAAAPAPPATLGNTCDVPKPTQDFQQLIQAAVAAAMAPLASQLVGLQAEVQAMRGNDLEEPLEDDLGDAQMAQPGRAVFQQKLRPPGPYAK